jgi:hypothetical protein
MHQPCAAPSHIARHFSFARATVDFSVPSGSASSSAASAWVQPCPPHSTSAAPVAQWSAEFPGGALIVLAAGFGLLVAMFSRSAPEAAA